MTFFPDLIRAGQIGTVWTGTVTQISSGVEVTVDLSGNSLLQMEFMRPDNSSILVTATGVSPLSNGVITYTDSTGIFNQVGRWKVRGIVTFSPTSYFKGSWTGFQWITSVSYTSILFLRMLVVIILWKNIVNVDVNK
jgi:hypothetical protein